MSTLSQQLDEFQRNRRTVFYCEYSLTGPQGGHGLYSAGPFDTAASAEEYKQLLLDNDHEQRIFCIDVQPRRAKP